MAGMLTPIDIAGLIKNGMVQPISESMLSAPYPPSGGVSLPPPPIGINPSAPPPLDTATNDMMVNIPAMPQAQAPNPMMQPPVPDEISKWMPALNILGQFSNQIGDAQMRENLPADVYLKIKGQQIEKENADQDRLLRNLQLEADAKYQQQNLDIRREELAMRRQELLSGGNGSSYMQDARALMANDPSLSLNDAYALARSGLPRGITFGPDGAAVIPGFTEATTDISAAQSKGGVIGTEKGTAESKLEMVEAGLPGLISVKEKLSKLGKIATYTKAGIARDEFMRQFGMEMPDSAVARADYISTIDNEVLPLLRETFGSAFTVAEGEKLRSTLGNENLSPAEKDAALNAFIEAKQRDIKKLSAYTEREATYSPVSIDNSPVLDIDAEIEKLKLELSQ